MVLRISNLPHVMHERQFIHRGRLFEVVVPNGSIDSNPDHAHAPLPRNVVEMPTRYRSVQRFIAAWQSAEATKLCLHIVGKHLPRLGTYALRYKGLRFCKMRRRWGQCSASGVVTLNAALVCLPEVLIESVVVHELAHLVHMNHSEQFYDYVADILPNYRELDKQVNQWGAVLQPTPTGSAEQRWITM
jgi:predicted metal-dependent hydrolase